MLFCAACARKSIFLCHLVRLNTLSWFFFRYVSVRIHRIGWHRRNLYRRKDLVCILYCIKQQKRCREPETVDLTTPNRWLWVASYGRSAALRVRDQYPTGLKIWSFCRCCNSQTTCLSLALVVMIYILFTFWNAKISSGVTFLFIFSIISRSVSSSSKHFDLLFFSFSHSGAAIFEILKRVASANITHTEEEPNFTNVGWSFEAAYFSRGLLCYFQCSEAYGIHKLVKIFIEEETLFQL